jgi:hypothetical protein
LNKTIKQHNTVFKFWLGKRQDENSDNDTIHNLLLVQRVKNGVKEIIFSDYVKDGDFSLEDINNDGFRDLVSYYHDDAVVHLFTPKTNNFLKSQFYLPYDTYLLDTNRLIYWCYKEPDWGPQIPYSTLYSLENYHLHCYYTIKYFRKDVEDGNSPIISVRLFKIINGDINKQKLIKTFKIDKNKKFDYKSYWKTNYKSLLNVQ